MHLQKGEVVVQPSQFAAMTTDPSLKHFGQLAQTVTQQVSSSSSSLPKHPVQYQYDNANTAFGQHPLAEMSFEDRDNMETRPNLKRRPEFKLAQITAFFDKSGENDGQLRHNSLSFEQ